jgi:DNA-binding SARP family transcriptional activator
VQFRVLGALEVLDPSGAALDLGGMRERALLALLLLHPNQVVAAERLAEDLWGERMPQGAAHALRVHVSRLRRALRPAGADARLVTRPPGYVLEVDDADLDAARFAELHAQGRVELAAGSPVKAAETLRAALALWRGPVLDDLLDAPAARSTTARLEEARLAALEDRIDADLAAGRQADLVGELDALTGAHPTRERMWGQRMLALYRCGRQAEALRVYAELRSRLDAELGIAPGAALVDLHTAILRQDPALDPPDQRSGPAPLPPLLTEMGRVFVGRGDELARLDALWRAPRADGPRLALVSGEPGVGKTRLAAELARAVHADGGAVLAGRCDEDLVVPYQPFVEALRDWPGGLGPHASELARLVPEVAGRPSDLPPPVRSDPETERYRLFDAVAAWLVAASTERPLLLVLDDVQWAATPTLQLLRHVSRTVGARQLLILATYRDTELTRHHPLGELLADLRRQPGVARLHLAGFDEPAVAAYMEATAGHALAPDDRRLAGTVHAETAGNPFFVRELLRHLAETGQILRRGDGWAAEPGLGIPDGVREVVGRRLARLSERTYGVLRLAAVVGVTFELPLVAAAGELGEEELLASLEEALDARLIVEVPGGGLRYRFVHAIVRSTLHDALTGARLAMLHRRVAVALEDLHPDALPELAFHWGRAGSDRTRAVDYAVRAGERAVAQLADEEAVTYFRQAHDLLAPADEPRRVELLIALGEAQRRAGHAAHRQTLLAAAGLARSRGDVDGLARAAIANSPGSKPSMFGITDHERVATLEAALNAVGPGDDPRRARLLAVLALELFHTPDRRRRLAASDEALTIARRLDQPEVLSDVLSARPFAIGGPETLAERLADTAELLRVARRLGDPVIEHRAWWSRFRVAVEVGDTAEADRCLAAERALLEDVNQPTPRWMTGLQEVAKALRQGRFADAGPLTEAVHELGRRTGQPDARLYYAIQLFQRCYEQGRLADAERVVTEVVAASPELPAIRAALALLYAETGRVDEAGALFADIAGDDLAALPVEASTMVAFGFCAELCFLLHDTHRAAQLHTLLAPYPDQITVWAAGLGTGSVAYGLGRLAHVLGELGEADAWFTAAAAIEERAAAPPWSTRTRRAHAQVFAERVTRR